MEISVERESILNEKTQLLKVCIIIFFSIKKITFVIKYYVFCLKEIRQYQQRIDEMQNTEIDLRNQISLYNEKYEEFQNALARSNKVFAGFKGDMELVS